MTEQTALEVPERMLTVVPTVTSVRTALVKISNDMYDRSKPYIEGLLSEGSAPSHDAAMRDAFVGLATGNTFTFVLAAVLRVANEADPVLGERLARLAHNALECGLDWFEDANDDLDDAEAADR